MKTLPPTIALAALLGGCCFPAMPGEPDKNEPAKKAGDPDKAEERDPFAPSVLMREQARRAVARPAGVNTAEQPAERTTLPTVLAVKAAAKPPILTGLIVKDKRVLACFQAGNSSALVAPGESFQLEETKYTFVKCEGETATLRDQDGIVRELKPGASEKPRPAEERGDNLP